MCEYLITGEYVCSKNNLSNANIEKFTPGKKVTVQIPDDNTCGIDDKGNINVCDTQSICNPNNTCSVYTDKMGILGGRFDTGGHFKGQNTQALSVKSKSQPVQVTITDIKTDSNKCGQDSDGVLHICKENTYCQSNGMCTGLDPLLKNNRFDNGGNHMPIH